jgi:hypothetical protein
MINENERKQLMKEVALKLMDESGCWDEFKHGLDDEDSFLVTVINRITGLTMKEVNEIRKEYFKKNEDEDDEDEDEQDDENEDDDDENDDD